MKVLWIWIRIILGSRIRIRIRIKVKSPIRITVKILELWRLKMEQQRAVDAHNEGVEGQKMHLWRACRLVVVACLHHFDEEQDPGTDKQSRIRIRIKVKRQIRIRCTTLWSVNTARTRLMRFGGSFVGGGAFYCHCPRVVGRVHRVPTPPPLYT
jgi:hypothetical protein